MLLFSRISKIELDADLQLAILNNFCHSVFQAIVLVDDKDNTFVNMRSAIIRAQGANALAVIMRMPSGDCTKLRLPSFSGLRFSFLGRPRCLELPSFFFDD